jgi:tRNA threonylcarbamoyladenosine dehydratase
MVIMHRHSDDETANPRFGRTELLIGKEAFAKLLRSHIMVIGLGAVGSYAVEALARGGVGRLSIVDFDSIKYSNFNRQLLAVESNLNRFKVDAARERIEQINPDCVVHPHRIFVDGKVAGNLFDPRPDVIIDAFDSLGPKVYFMEACVKAGQNLISCLGAASRMDPFAVRIGDISETSGCPLARMIRKKLHKLGIQKGIRCVYSIEPPAVSAVKAEPEQDQYVRGRPRRPIGSISYVVGIVGLMAAGDAISQIIGKTIVGSRFHA